MPNLLNRFFNKNKVSNVIIVSLGGVRNSESINDKSHQYIPNLWNRMFKEGVLYTNLVDLNLQFHIPSAQAIDTGRLHSIYSVINGPSIFQYIRKQYRFPAYKVWSIGHWMSEATVFNKTCDFDRNTFPCYARVLPPSLCREASKILSAEDGKNVAAIQKLMGENISFWPLWDANDAVLYSIFRKVMQAYKPKFIHFIMNAPDCGHFSTYSQYVVALKNSDSRIFNIWQSVRNEPFYKGNTYLIVAVDHPRNRYYMQHNEYDSPRKVWMYIYGPNIKKSVVIDRPVHHADIFSTVAYIMDVSVHPNQGEILRDCFDEKFNKSCG